MARTDVASIQVISLSGITPSYEAANVDGNMWRNSGRETIHVINGGGGAVTVTLPTPATTGSGLTIEDRDIVVGAGADAMIGTLKPGEHNQAAGTADAGKAYIDYSGITSVTFGVFRS